MRPVRRALVILLLILVVGLGAVFVYVRGRGFSARSEPGRLEESVARFARRVRIPGGAGGEGEARVLYPSSTGTERRGGCGDGSAQSKVTRRVAPADGDRGVSEGRRSARRSSATKSQTLKRTL